MEHRTSDTGKDHRRNVSLPLYFFLGFIILVVSADQTRADPDVYAVLPGDTRVIQYGMGDVDGDSREDLAVFYTSGGVTRLTLFKGKSGHWSPWWADDGLLSAMDRAVPSSVELMDVNGDGKDEILTYYLTEGDGGMAARIIELETTDPEDPTAGVLLEDTTVPPGYPLFGTENGVPSVTFLKMPLRRGDSGHRRVYCWYGERFEKCLEIPWEKP